MNGAPSPASPPVLHASDVERRFGAARVLRGISLAVKAGECHLIVGPNGAGKSTLLRVLSGLARPTSGSVRIGGGDPGRDPGARRRIGLLSHQSQLYDDLTVLENLTFAARLFGIAAPRQAAAAQAEGFGLGPKLDEPVRRLSAGLRQRTAIARSLLHAPSVLLLDEPATGLDPVASAQVMTRLASEQSRGAALVLVSHTVHEAWPLATHAHALVGGRWVISGPAGSDRDDFLRRYRETIGA